jgi:uncharacterized protein involved in exopolysaccharide biosynthesis
VTEPSFSTLVRRWPLLLVGLLLGAGVGIVIALTASPAYTATATGIVTPVQPGGNESPDSGVPIAEAYSRIADDPPIVAEAATISGVEVPADEINDAVRASASPEVPLVEIEATRDNANDAARLADGIVSALASQSQTASEDLGFVLRRFAPASTPTSRSNPSLVFRALVGAFLGLMASGLLVLLVPPARRRRPEA